MIFTTSFQVSTLMLFIYASNRPLPFVSSSLELQKGKKESSSTRLDTSFHNPAVSKRSLSEEVSDKEDVGCGSDELSFKFKITTDEYPAETTWILSDIAGNQIGSSTDFPPLDQLFTYEYPYCVSQGMCLVFTIYDSYGDGLFLHGGAGYMLIYKDNIIKEGGIFVYDETSVIGDECPSSTPSLSPAPSLLLSPTNQPTKACVPLHVLIFTDAYPEDISWTLKDIDGNLIDSFENFIFPHFFYPAMICVQEYTCMEFSIYDSHGDGLIAGHGGGYYIYYNFTLIKNGGSFGFEETLVIGDGCPSYAPSHSPKPSVSRIPSDHLSTLPSFAPSSSSLPTTSRFTPAPITSFDFITEDEYGRRQFPLPPIRPPDQLSYQSYPNCSSPLVSENLSARVGCLALPNSIIPSKPDWAGKLHFNHPVCFVDQTDGNRSCRTRLPMSKSGLPQGDAYSKMKFIQSDLSSAFKAEVIPGEDRYTLDSAIGDVDNDGWLDRVVLSVSPFWVDDNTYVSLYLNNRKGGFHPPIDLIENVGYDSMMKDMIALGDIDGDGFVDIVSIFGGRLRVLYNDGSGTYTNYLILHNVGSSIYSLTLADCDNNGYLDVLIGGGYSNYLLLNKGGRLGDFTYLPMGENLLFTKEIIAGDVNLDGWEDIILVGIGVNQLLLNSGNGNFERIDLPGGYQQTNSVVLGDVDGDGYLDIVLTGGDGGAFLYSPIKLLMNKFGNMGVFDEPIILSGSMRTNKLSLADINGDGYLDIIAVASLESHLILLNDGSGTTYDTFILPGVSRRSLNIYSISVADIDRDSTADIIIGTEGQDLILFNRQNMVFSESILLPPENRFSNTHGISLGDLNGDTFVDMVVANGDLVFDESYLLLNNGFGEFEEVTILKNSSNIFGRSVELADLNGDGAIDILMGNLLVLTGDYRDNDPTGLKLWLNDGDGQFGEMISIPINQTCTNIELGDINEDDNLDIICSGTRNNGNPEFPPTNKLLLGIGNGSFFDPITIHSEENVASVIIASDINNDGHIDLIVGGPNHNRVLLNLGFGNLSYSEPISLPGENITTKVIAAADINGDGWIDLIVGSGGYDDGNLITSVQEDGFTFEKLPNYLLMNSGDGTFNDVHTLPGGDHDTKAMAVGDIDGDGDLDLVFGNMDGPVQMLINNHGTFDEALSLTSEMQANSISLADLNQDGYLDIIIGLKYSMNQVIFVSPCQSGAKLHASSWCFRCPTFMGRPKSSFSGNQQSICRECLPDLVQNSQNSDGCSLCQIGQRRNLGEDFCSDCPGGTFYNSSVTRSEVDIAVTVEQSRCVDCPVGSFSSPSQLAIDNCFECLPGSYQNISGSSFCQVCEEGTYQPGRAQDSCTQCTVGGYCNAIDTCDGGFTPCPAGTYNDKPGQQSVEACIPCEKGTFSAKTGSDKKDFCTLCPEGTYTEKIGQTACIPCKIGTHQPKPGQTSCIACNAGTYADNVGFIECISCPFRLSSDIGSDICSICDDGFYLGDASADEVSIFRQPSEHCFDCPSSASCPTNTTLQTIGVPTNFWRDSLDTSMLYECEAGSTCKGVKTSEYEESAVGETLSPTFYCDDGYTGPKCSECVDDKRYFNRDKMRCMKCPESVDIVSRLFLIIIGLLMIVGAVRIVLNCFKGAAANLISNLSLQAKLKVTISFIQVISTLRDAEQVKSIYGVELDSRFKAWFDFLSYFTIDIFKYISLPIDCLGSTKTQLIVGAIWPFIAIAIVFLLQYAVLITIHCFKKCRNMPAAKCFNQESSSRSLQESTKARNWNILYWAIFLFYFVLPMVANGIFVAISCQAYKTNDYSGAYTSYLIANPDIECNINDKDYSSILVIFWIIFILWLVLVPILFVAILAVIRESIRTGRITALAKASRFLWSDYTSEMMFWDVIDTMKRLFLTGFIMFVDPENGSNKLFRLICAIVVTMLFLMILAASRPYKRVDDYYLALVSNYILVCCLTTGVVLRLCEEENDSICEDFIGLSLNSFKASATMVFLTVGMSALSIISLIVIAINTINSPKIKVVKSDEYPKMETSENCSRHIHISRLFTSKDKVHSISLKLQQYLPELIISDSSDVNGNDHDLRRKNIDGSVVFMILFDVGYFQSKICQDEVLYAISLKKPIVVLYEGKSEFIEYMKSECAVYIPDDVETRTLHDPMETVLEYIFAEEPIRWLENDDDVFMATTLRIIFLRILSCLPCYQDSDELDSGLRVPGELDEDSIQIKSQLIIHYCQSNVGSLDVAQEMKNLIPKKKGQSLIFIQPYEGSFDVDDKKMDNDDSDSDLSSMGEESSKLSLFLSLASFRGSRRTINEEDSFNDTPIVINSTTHETVDMKTTIIPEDESLHDSSLNSASTQVFLLYLDSQLFHEGREEQNVLRAVLKQVMKSKMRILIVHDDNDDISLNVHWESLTNSSFDEYSNDVKVVSLFRSGHYRETSLRQSIRSLNSD